MKDARNRDMSVQATQEITNLRRGLLEQRVVDTPRPTPLREFASSAGVPWNEPIPYIQPSQSIPIPQRDLKNAQLVRERCRQLCISVFFREQAPVRSVGFTSPAGVLANDSKAPAVLVDCNWENPNLHNYFGLPLQPGLADWLRGTCREGDIRHKVGPNLTFIPAGDGMYDIVKLLQKVQDHDLHAMLARANELFVVDLPSVTTSGYGRLAASLVQSLFVVVQAGVTTNTLMAETCLQLKDLPVEGVILNQMESRIPHWIRELL